MLATTVILAVMAFIIGASVGSFLNLAADRIPAARSIITPRSFCEACGRPLGSLDLVPVLSYIWLRGQCRYCRATIPLRLMVVEGITGILFTLVYLRHGFEIEFVVLGLAVSLMVVVALIDFERGLILNSMMYPAVVVLIVLSPFWTELGLSRSFLGDESLGGTLGNSLLTGLGSFLVFLAIAVVYPNGMGGGDVKLGGVIGLLIGYPGALIALWLAVVSGGAVAIGLLVLRKMGRKDAMPFGPFLASGAIVALLAGNDISSWYNDIGDFVAGT